MRPAEFFEHWQRIAAQGLYPNFRAFEIPVMVFDGTDTWLFGAAQVPAGFVRDGQWFSHRGRFHSLTANTATIATPSVMESDPLEAAFIAAHEALHAFQAQHFPHWGANEMTALTYPTTDVQQLLERRLETVALYRAIEGMDAACAALDSQSMLYCTSANSSATRV